jgi:hypothetical protein
MQPLPLLVTVAAKGGGYIATLKDKPDKALLPVTPTNRDDLPAPGYPQKTQPLEISGTLQS